MKFNKIILTVFTLFLLLFSVSSISAADLNVNDATTHKDISDWMNSDTTVSGDNLVFDGSSYELDDTIEVTKQVNIVSNKNTQINFYKNKEMFYVTSSGITFSGLTLNHYGSGTEDVYSGAILAKSDSNFINVDKMVFNLNNNYLTGILIKDWQGTLTNSIFNLNSDFVAAVGADNFNGNIRDISIISSGYTNFGIIVYSKWVGSVYSSSFSGTKDLTYFISVNQWIGSIYSSLFSLGGSDSIAINTFYYWKGNVKNTKISTSGARSVGIAAFKWVGGLYSSNVIASGIYSTGVYVDNIWTGTISKSKINANGKGSFGVYIFSPKSKGTISQSTVSAKRGIAISIPKSIKVKTTKTYAKNKASKIYILGPKLKIGSAYRAYYNAFLDLIGDKGSRYLVVEVHNIGEYSSKTSYLTITASGYKKVIKVKPIKSEYYREITIPVPKRISSSKIVKYAKVTYYDGKNKKIVSKSFKFR